MTANSNFQFRGPITQERAENATEWMVENAEKIALAKATKERRERMLKVTKALAMKASGQTSAAAQEREALVSKQYADADMDVFNATLEYEKLLNTRLAAQEVIEVWRSINSNLRAARV